MSAFPWPEPSVMQPRDGASSRGARRWGDAAPLCPSSELDRSVHSPPPPSSHVPEAAARTAVAQRLPRGTGTCQAPRAPQLATPALGDGMVIWDFPSPPFSLKITTLSVIPKRIHVTGTRRTILAPSEQFSCPFHSHTHTLDIFSSFI